MAYLKEQGLLRELKKGTGGSFQLQEEQEVQGGGGGGVQELEELLLEEQLQHRPPPPLSHERFEAAFARNLRKEFHLFPFFGYLFTRDLREEGGQWTPVRQCFINLGLTPGKAIVVSRCAALIRRYQRIESVFERRSLLTTFTNPLLSSFPVHECPTSLPVSRTGLILSPLFH